MADYAAPAGPPPPKAPIVPEGWAVRWNEQYKEWFYVNTFTRESTWTKPEHPVYADGAGPSPDAPPGYQPGPSPAPTDAKTNPYRNESAQGSSSAVGGPAHGAEDDAAMAARLQAEEDARARSAHSPGYGGYPSPAPSGGNPAYHQGGHNPPYAQPTYDHGGASGSTQSNPQELPPRDKGKSSGGFLGKLKAKVAAAGASSGSHGSYGHGAPYGGHGGHYPQQAYYGQPQHYGRPPFGGGGFGHSPYGHSPYGRRPGGGGIGAAGGAAAGLGAGLLGGAVLASALDDDDYQEGFEDGADFGGDDGGGGE